MLNGKNINLKSMAHFSNLLLLEKKDWGRNGVYLENTPNEMKYDCFVAIRIKPNIKKICKPLKEPYMIENFSNIIDTTSFYFDIPGVKALCT